MGPAAGSEGAGPSLKLDDGGLQARICWKVKCKRLLDGESKTTVQAVLLGYRRDAAVKDLVGPRSAG